MAVSLLHNVIELQLLGIQLHYFPISCVGVVSAKIRCDGTMCLDEKDILNLSSRHAGSVLSRFRTVVLIFMVVLALAGRCARKSRQVFEGFVNGLNLVVTSTMCFVIIATHPQVADERISLRILTLIQSTYLIQV